MTNPVLAAASIGASAGGSILGAIGANKEGKAAQEMYGYQAGIAQLNKKIALQNRDFAYATGEHEAERYGMAARQRSGTIKAGASASGLDIGSGSKADLLTSQQVITDIDMATIRNNTARKAYGFEVEASSLDKQSEMYLKAGADARKSGKIKAMSSLISGAGSVSDKWLQGKSTGVF